MQYREWRKNKAKSDTSFVSAWRDSRGLPALSDAENAERFDSYLWLMRELDKIVLRKMRAEEREERELSGSLSFERERYGENVDFDDISLDVDDEVDVDGLSDEDLPF
jgi:hypothetical protein